MKRSISFVSTVAALLLTAAAARAAVSTTPNVIILLDSSGSMSFNFPALPPYASATTYPAFSGLGFTISSSTVYQQTTVSGSPVYTAYANSISAVTLPGARTALTTYGLWFGTIGTSPLKLFVGNYLNYENQSSSAFVPTTKIQIAQRVLNELVSTVPNIKFSVMDFNSSATGGNVVAPFGVSTTTIVADINAISPVGATPSGPALTDAGTYYSSGFGGFTSPVTSVCQPNSIIFATDGEFNVGADPATVATTLHAPPQNLIINTIGIDDPLDALSGAGITDLQQTAANGGGQFFDGTTAPALEQALLSLPSAVSVSAPIGGSVLSGSVSLSAKLQVPSSCVGAVQFYLNGSPLLSQITASPFTTSWDTTQNANGNYSLTVGYIDVNGNQTLSLPIAVGINNVVTLPVVTSLSVSVGVTSATVSWQTNVPTDAQVSYGTTTSYGQSTPLQDTSPKTTSHVAVIAGLTPGTAYDFQVVSHDSAGRAATSGSVFTTQGIAASGVLDHYAVTFLNNGNSQTGPGTKSGSSPYVLAAGDCFSTTIEAIDSVGAHNNYTGPVTIAQYLLNSSGVETSLAPGIALRNNAQLGVSSMTLTMTNGFLFLGSQTDTTQQLCFYRATREPLDSSTPGAPGDLNVRVIETSTPSVTGISSGYVVWRQRPSQLLLLAPNQAPAPATPYGFSGTTVTETQGAPFPVTAYVTDLYWNLDIGSADQLSFSSSYSTSTSFNPFSGTAAAGAVTSSVTFNVCNVAATLTVIDAANPALTSAQAPIQIAACGAQRFYGVSVPGQATAGVPFVTTITVHNLNIPVGTGGVLFSGSLSAVVQSTDGIHYTPIATPLGVSVFSFTVPEGTVGDYVYTITNQSLQKAGTFYLDLTAQNPSDLQGASSLAGPMLVIPGPAAKIVLTQGSGSVPAFTGSPITVSVTDSLGNGISGQTILLNLTQGTGNLSAGSASGVPSLSLTTDASGNATATFTSGGVSETDMLTAQAPGLPALPPVTAQVLVSLLGNAPIAAYPSPVNINQQPLTIEYSLPQNSDVVLTITDLFGHAVWKQSYAAGTTGGSAGFNRVSWNGQNGLGRTLAVGVYALHIHTSAGGQTTTAKTKFGVIK